MKCLAIRVSAVLSSSPKEVAVERGLAGLGGRGGGGGGGLQAGELRVDDGGEDGNFGEHGELEGESDAVVQEDVGDPGVRDVGIYSRYRVRKTRFIHNLPPELREPCICILHHLVL